MMNILMSGNDNVYPGMELAIYSTLTHNKGINWYIFTMDIEIDTGDGQIVVFCGLNSWQKNKLKKIVSYLDNTSKITFIDMYNLYMKYLSGNINENSPFTPYAALRLLADVALPNIKHVLYLDCDTAVQGNISGILDFLKFGKDYYAYVCPDACGYEGEMVSGVMLMDLERIRKDGFLERARNNIRNNIYQYPDQDALRDAGKPYPLPETYSYLYELELCTYKPLILHFTNKLSPKVYGDEGRTVFYRKYPSLDYVKKGVEMIDIINFGTAEDI